MMKLFFFSYVAHLYLIMSSPLMSQYGDSEPKQYEHFGLVNAFHKYLTISTWETYSSFRSYATSYYNQSPIDCLKLLGRHRSNWVFWVLFWRALAGPSKFINPAIITPIYYLEVLKWISCIVKSSFLKCNCINRKKFTDELETISLLIKLAEKACSELNSLEINDNYIKFINEISYLIAIWKYFVENISVDFANQTIEYYSRTFSEIGFIVKTIPPFNEPLDPC